MQKYVLQFYRVYWAVVVVLYIVFIVRSSVICVQMCVTSEVQHIRTCSRLIVSGLSQDVIYIYIRVCVRTRMPPISHLLYLNLMEILLRFCCNVLFQWRYKNPQPNSSLCWEQDRQIDRERASDIYIYIYIYICTAADSACHSLHSVSLFSRGKHSRIATTRCMS